MAIQLVQRTFLTLSYPEVKGRDAVIASTHQSQIIGMRYYILLNPSVPATTKTQCFAKHPVVQVVCRIFRQRSISRKRCKWFQNAELGSWSPVPLRKVTLFALCTLCFKTLATLPLTKIGQNVLITDSISSITDQSAIVSKRDSLLEAGCSLLQQRKTVPIAIFKRKNLTPAYFSLLSPASLTKIVWRNGIPISLHGQNHPK